MEVGDRFALSREAGSKLHDVHVVGVGKEHEVYALGRKVGSALERVAPREVQLAKPSARSTAGVTRGHQTENEADNSDTEVLPELIEHARLQPLDHVRIEVQRLVTLTRCQPGLCPHRCEGQRYARPLQEHG
eukprot:3078343-Rhodomonas_salina.1